MYVQATAALDKANIRSDTQTSPPASGPYLVFRKRISSGKAYMILGGQLAVIAGSHNGVFMDFTT